MNIRQGLSLFFLSTFLCLSVSVPTVGAEFTYLATHPEASRHYAPGEYGRHIKVLRAYSGKIYMGYGQNDGKVVWQNCPADDLYGSPAPPNYPYGIYCDIKLRYLDPATDTLSAPVAEIRAQQADTLEVMGDDLYFLAEDPDENDYPFVKCTSADNCFKAQLSGATPAHLYSATVLNGDFYIAGSEGYKGVIWRSSDGGSTWQIETQRQTVITKPVDVFVGCCSRYNGIGSYQGEIYAQSYDYHSGYGYHSTVFDGIRWDKSQDLYSGRRRRVFNDKMVFISFFKLYSYDGMVRNNEYAPFIRDYAISNGYFYVLRYDGQVYRTSNLNDWFYVDSLPTNTKGCSIEVLNSVVYVGTEDSKIYKSTAIAGRNRINLFPILQLLLSEEDTPFWEDN